LLKPLLSESSGDPAAQVWRWQEEAQMPWCIFVFVYVEKNK
jgi:hypothetical protein